MAKVVALILVVMAVAVLVSVAECANKMDTDAVLAAASADNYTAKVEAFKAALSVPPADNDTAKVEALKAALSVPPVDINTAKVEAFKAALLVPAAKCSANVEECIAVADSHIRKALDDVVAAALPAKKTETELVTFMQSKIAASTLAKAKATGDANKVAAVSIAYIMAANAVLAAAPADKFTVMQETFEAPVDAVA